MQTVIVRPLDLTSPKLPRDSYEVIYLDGSVKCVAKLYKTGSRANKNRWVYKYDIYILQGAGGGERHVSQNSLRELLAESTAEKCLFRLMDILINAKDLTDGD